MSTRGAKKRERWVRTLHAGYFRPACMFMSWPHRSSCDALFIVVLDGAQGKESWAGAQPKPRTVCFPALCWAHCMCQQISPVCSAPLLFSSQAYQPLVRRWNHKGLNLRESPRRRESPSSSWPRCIRLLLSVPFPVPMWCCRRTRGRFFCPSLVADGLQTAISWTQLCVKNWMLLLWFLLI